MKKFLPSLILLGASMVMATPQIFAQTASAQPTKSEKSAPKKAAAKKPATKSKAAEPEQAAGSDEDDKEPDIAGSVSIDYQCELGNSLTIFENVADDRHVALRWNKRLVRMTRVDTTTGANRFENRQKGLVWIGIPAKGMLLDSKKGQQLANECRNAEQLKQKAAVSEEPGILSSPDAKTMPETPAKPSTAKKPKE